MSVLTELQAELAEKVAEYRAARVAPTYSVDGRSFQHDGHRKALLEEIKELRLLIIQEGGGVEYQTIAYG